MKSFKLYDQAGRLVYAREAGPARDHWLLMSLGAFFIGFIIAWL